MYKKYQIRFNRTGFKVVKQKEREELIEFCNKKALGYGTLVLIPGDIASIVLDGKEVTTSYLVKETLELQK